MARVRPEATAYWNRDASGTCCWPAPGLTTPRISTTPPCCTICGRSFEPYTRGYYVNTEPSADEQRLRETYGDNYARLVQVED